MVPWRPWREEFSVALLFRAGDEAFEDDIVHKLGSLRQFLRTADGPPEEWQLAGFS